MRAIFVRQPYARCIAVGRKLVENRGRSTSYSGTVAIHAAKAHSPDGDLDPRVVELFGPDAHVTCCRPWGDPLYGLLPAWHLVLEDVVALPQPIYARGQVRVPWELPEDVAGAVYREVAACSG